jgi:uncharacterized membrane protein YhiD involved in acid resistance
MFRLLIWLSGAVGILVAIDRLGYWHEAAALAVLTAAIWWIVGGGVWVLHGHRGPRQGPRGSAADAAAVRESVERAERQAREREGAP